MGHFHLILLFYLLSFQKNTFLLLSVSSHFFKMPDGISSRVWKAQLGDLSPIDAFPTERKPKFRDCLKVFRHYLEVLRFSRRAAAIKVSQMLSIADPGWTNQSEAHVVRRLLSYWDLTL